MIIWSLILGSNAIVPIIGGVTSRQLTEQFIYRGHHLPFLRFVIDVTRTSHFQFASLPLLGQIYSSCGSHIRWVLRFLNTKKSCAFIFSKRSRKYVGTGRKRDWVRERYKSRLCCYCDKCWYLFVSERITIGKWESALLSKSENNYVAAKFKILANDSRVWDVHHGKTFVSALW